MTTAPHRTTWARWRTEVTRLKREIAALALAMADPRTPWYARLAAGCVVAYALSPLDLIPDPIPMLGYLDDLILLPLGLLLVIRLIPPNVLADCRQRAQTARPTSPYRHLATLGIVVLWLAAAALLTAWFLRLFF